MPRGIRNGAKEVHNYNIVAIITFEIAKLIFVHKLRTNLIQPDVILTKSKNCILQSRKTKYAQ